LAFFALRFFRGAGATAASELVAVGGGVGSGRGADDALAEEAIRGGEVHAVLGAEVDLAQAMVDLDAERAVLLKQVLQQPN
jgi:hypothetical protein